MPDQSLDERGFVRAVMAEARDQMRSFALVGAQDKSSALFCNSTGSSFNSPNNVYSYMDAQGLVSTSARAGTYCELCRFAVSNNLVIHIFNGADEIRYGDSTGGDANVGCR